MDSQRYLARAGCCAMKILDILMPRACIGCGRVLMGDAGVYSCPSCRLEYEFLEGHDCARCGGDEGGRPACSRCWQVEPELQRIGSVLKYRGLGERLVQELKYYGGEYLRDEIAQLISGKARWEAFLSGSVLVSVPLHQRRQRTRGYNQAEVIARAVAGCIADVEVLPCLARVRDTPSQTRLSRRGRRDNMAAAFRCTGKLPPGRRCVLVDDVMTSGATLVACALALGPQPLGISAFTLAHG